MSWMMVGSISRRYAKPPGKAWASTAAGPYVRPSAVNEIAKISRHFCINCSPHAERGDIAATPFTLRGDRPGDNSHAPYSRLPPAPSLPIALALMTPVSKSTFVLGHRHLLGIEGLSAADITGLLDLSEEYVELNRQIDKKRTSLRGRTQVNLFFEASPRTQSSFELAGKRLGADVMNMSVGISAMRKGETLLDTAITLNAMRPDILVVRHHASGAVELLAQKVDGSVINAGDGAHEHPTQALLDALTIRRNKGRIERLVVAICGDILHSRVARSNIPLLNTLGARVRVVAPSTLLPAGLERFRVEATRAMPQGLGGARLAP